MIGFEKRLRVSRTKDGPWYSAAAYDTNLEQSKSTVDEIIDIGDGLGVRNVYPTYKRWSFSAVLRYIENDALDILEESMDENTVIWVEYSTGARRRRGNGVVDNLSNYGDVSQIEEIDVSIRGAGKLERV